MVRCLRCTASPRPRQSPRTAVREFSARVGSSASRPSPAQPTTSPSWSARNIGSPSQSRVHRSRLTSSGVSTEKPARASRPKPSKHPSHSPGWSCAVTTSTPAGGGVTTGAASTTYVCSTSRLTSTKPNRSANSRDGSSSTLGAHHRQAERGDVVGEPVQQRGPDAAAPVLGQHARDDAARARALGALGQAVPEDGVAVAGEQQQPLGGVAGAELGERLGALVGDDRDPHPAPLLVVGVGDAGRDLHVHPSTVGSPSTVFSRGRPNSSRCRGLKRRRMGTWCV